MVLEISGRSDRHVARLLLSTGLGPVQRDSSWGRGGQSTQASGGRRHPEGAVQRGRRGLPKAEARRPSSLYVEKGRSKPH